MANDLRGVEIRLERAHEHIDALKHESRMFMMELPNPYGVSIDAEPVNGEYVVRVKINRRPSFRLGVLAADSAQSLRSALDMIAWQLALKGEDPPTDEDTDVGFPICTSRDKWEDGRTKRLLRRIDPKAREIIDSFQPYNRPGAPRLRVLVSLDNRAKHKAIPDLASLYISKLKPIGDFEVVSLIQSAFEDGDEIGRVRWPRPVVDLQKEFRVEVLCHVGFSKSGVGFSWPIDFFENAYNHIRDEILPAFRPFFTD